MHKLLWYYEEQNSMELVENVEPRKKWNQISVMHMNLRGSITGQQGE